MASAQDNVDKVTDIAVSHVDWEDNPKHPKGVDDALNFAREHASVEWSEAEERKLLRKLDFRIVPLLFIVGILENCDSGAFGVAAIFGMIQDLNLFEITSYSPLTTSLVRYSWASSAPIFGSVISQYPLLLLAQLLPLGKFSAGVAFYSGALALLTLTLTDFAPTIVLRFFYGFQGIAIPIGLIISAMWWTREEQPLRIGLWLSGSALGAVVGQAIDFGSASIGGYFAKSPWKWMYVILGSITVGYSIFYALLFPDSPLKAGFLTERERIIAVRRLEKNYTGIQTRKFKLSQVWSAFKDPQTYLLAVPLFSFSFATGALGSFGALLVTSFGYDAFKAIQLVMPASGISVVVMVLSGYLSSRFRSSRIIIAMLFMVPTILGNVLLWRMPRDNKAALLGGLYLSVFFYGSVIQLFGMVSANVAGQTKKSTVAGFVFTISATAGIASPFAFLGSEALIGYPTGIISVLSTCVAAEICLGLLLFHYKRFNRIRDKAANEVASSGLELEQDLSFLDLTEQENPMFRYQC